MRGRLQQNPKLIADHNSEGKCFCHRPKAADRLRLPKGPRGTSSASTLAQRMSAALATHRAGVKMVEWASKELERLQQNPKLIADLASSLMETDVADVASLSAAVADAVVAR